MTDKSGDIKREQLIFPDMDFQRVVEDNAEAAWLEYCRARGIDPAAGEETKK